VAEAAFAFCRESELRVDQFRLRKLVVAASPNETVGIAIFIRNG
jgi:hypothetical protein